MEKNTKKSWKKKLSSEQYHVIIEKGTERPFTGELLNNKKKGTYVCAACGNTIFSSETKFDSGTGWPSFYDVIDENRVKKIEDKSLWMKRIEVTCNKCGGHLGHVFNDGPKPTNLRYCINSVSLKFKESK